MHMSKADWVSCEPESCVHSTRVVFVPSKDKIRVRVPMSASMFLGGGLLYMVAYNLRKVENRDRYPDPPRRYSIGAVPRLVAPIAWVRFPVAAAVCAPVV